MSGIVLMGRFVRALHVASAGLMIAAVVMGYALQAGRLDVGLHVRTGFFFALGISFAHAMTIFYLAGAGVGMREAAGARAASRRFEELLEAASVIRKRLALPVGGAIASLMAATILGGGSHTRWLPLWPHHAFSLAALALNLFASWRAARALAAQEELFVRMEAALLGPGAPLIVTNGARRT
jgi:hypothetical protein